MVMNFFWGGEEGVNKIHYGLRENGEFHFFSL